MSRYRDDWGEEDYGRPRRRRGYYGQGSIEGPRGEYGRSGEYERRGGYGRADDYDERTVVRDPRAPRDYEDYGRERYAPREGYYGEGRYGEQRGYEGRSHAGRDEEGRSLFDEGRDFLRERFGWGRRGTTRSHLRCRDIMTRDVTVATRETNLHEVARMMRDEDTGVIPVVDYGGAPPPDPNVSPEGREIRSRSAGNGRIVGLITDRDIVVRTVAEGKDPREVRAEEIMTTDLHAAQPNDRVIDAIRKMGDKQVRRIPVVDRDGNLRGIISMADVALETEADRELAEALEEISSGASFWNRIFG